MNEVSEENVRVSVQKDAFWESSCCWASRLEIDRS